MAKAKRSAEKQSTRPTQDPEVVLVQARVPRALYERIKRAADAELISMAAYMRRTLQNHVPGG